MDAVDVALKRIGLDKPTWQTVVVGTTREADVPAATLWETWSRLEEWPTWSKPLIISTRWLGPAEWKVGARFEQRLDLGFPLGTTTSAETVRDITPGRQVSWWKDDKGVKSCHIWSFEPLPGDRTRVTNIEVFHGLPMGLVKPLVTNGWQRKFEASLEGLISKAQAHAEIT